MATRARGVLSSARMRTVLVASLALAALVAPAAARAQELAAPPVLELTPPALADGRSYVHAGIALVVSGAASSAAGAGIVFGMGGILGSSVGGTLMALGGLALFSGIPTWIVGAVRESLAAAGSQRRSQVASDWEVAGVITFCAGMVAAIVGSALVGTSFGQWMPYNPDQLIAGSTMLVTGAVVAAFIGAPMWAEGARF